jgi:predicted PurR-regulated permease PerM
MPERNYSLLIMASIIVGVALFYFLAPVLTPFFVGGLLAYLIDPLVSQLQRWRIPRLISVVMVFFSMLMVLIFFILLLIPLIQEQIDVLFNIIPSMIVWLQNTALPWIMGHLNINIHSVNTDSVKAMILDNWTKAGGAADWLVKTILHSGRAVFEWAIMLVLIPVVTFYLLCDWERVMVGLRSLLPRAVEPIIVKLALECDGVLSAFFRGQLLVMLALSFFYSIGLSIVGLQISIVVGLIVGLMSIVPYLGPIVGIVIASIAAYVQTGDFAMVYLIWGVFALGHLLESTILTPYLVGNRIGLHPVVVIFAVLAGGTLFGFLGVLLALPVAAVLMVWVRYLFGRYRQSLLYCSE